MKDDLPKIEDDLPKMKDNLPKMEDDLQEMEDDLGQKRAQRSGQLTAHCVSMRYVNRARIAPVYKALPIVGNFLAMPAS